LKDTQNYSNKMKKLSSEITVLVCMTAFESTPTTLRHRISYSCGVKTHHLG